MRVADTKLFTIVLWRVLLPAWALAGAPCVFGQTNGALHNFFRRQIGLGEDQIAAIGRGAAVARVLPSERPAEMVIFGAVFIHAEPQAYVRFAFDFERLRRLPAYHGVNRVSEPPTLRDFEGFVLEPGDLKDLRSCRPGKCSIQLPAEAMRELQTAVDWSDENAAAARINRRLQTLAFDVLQRYRAEGNTALGIYRDSAQPFDVNRELRTLLGRAEVLPVYIPELTRYLLEYPNASLPRLDSTFYWEKVSFGLKPTLRLNHAAAFHFEGPRGAAEVVAVKQLYASHYFQLALEITECIPGRDAAGKPGFHLISLRGSTQQGLTGWKGAILRRIIAGRTRSAQEKALLEIKRMLEAGHAARQDVSATTVSQDDGRPAGRSGGRGASL